MYWERTHFNRTEINACSFHERNAGAKNQKRTDMQIYAFENFAIADSTNNVSDNKFI